MGTARRHRGRRALPVLLAVALALAWLPGAAWGEAREISEELCDPPFASGFDDIEGSAHEDNVRCMADHGLTEGVGDGSRFAPRRDVTRGQMASFVARFLEAYTGAPLPDGDPERFDDVPADDGTYPHATNIHGLAEIEVVDGTSSSGGDAYAPQAGVTRAQMASMIRRALSWAESADARVGAAPPAAARAAFDDTRGSVHEDNIDAIAAVGIVEGFADGTYRPGAPVKRDQMASFVMRSYDYALTEGLGRQDGGQQPTALLSPTTEQPAFPISPGDEIDVTFRTEGGGSYELFYRDPDTGDDGSLGGGDGEPGDWTPFDGDDTSGEVAAGTHDVTVTLPESEEDEGVRDLRLRFVPDDAPSTEILDTQEAALVVADGIVINLTQETVHFDMQPAVDEADDGDALQAVGDFEETVEIAGVDDLILSGVGEDTVLEGTIVVDDVTGLTLSDMTVTSYTTVSPLGLGITGSEIGVALGTSTDVRLDALVLRGSGTGTDDIGVEVGDDMGVTISNSTFAANSEGVLVSGDGEHVTIGDDNRFAGNARGVLVDAGGQQTTITGSDFTANSVGVRVDAPDVGIEGNAFDDNEASGVRLFEEGERADVTGNAFGDGNAEHVRFFTESYGPDHEDTLIGENSYQTPPETAESGEWTIVRPPSGG